MSTPLPVMYIVDASVAVTGAFVAASQAARALAGTARVVLVLPQGSTIPASRLHDFWRVEYIPMGTLSKTIRALLRYIPVLCIGAWQLRALMRRDGAQRLQLNDFYLMHGALLRVLGFRGQIMQWVRCDPKRFAGPLAAPMLAIAKHSANHLVAVSAYVQSLLPATSKAALIYDYYVGPTRPRRTWGADEEKIYVYVGNYIPGKGQDMAIAAFAKAAPQDATLRLHFYGGDMGLEKNRAYRAGLEVIAQQQGLAGCVMFHDAIEDSYAVVAHAYAALNFSHCESFSMTVLEASGAGVPVIATMSGGPQEIVVDGVTGYMIAVGDSAAAAERVLMLASDPAKATAMGQAGAEHIQQHFSMQRFLAQHHALD